MTYSFTRNYVKQHVDNGVRALALGLGSIHDRLSNAFQYLAVPVANFEMDFNDPASDYYKALVEFLNADGDFTNKIRALSDEEAIAYADKFLELQDRLAQPLR